MNLNLILLCFIISMGLITPSKLAFAEKNFTKLDKLASYIKTHSNNNELVSYHIASAILHSGGDVRTLTAIGRVESSFSPSARGDSGASEGIFQIQKAHWGIVPKNVYKQARLASNILSEVKLIRRYNGAGKAARLYEARVLSYRKSIKV